MAEVGEVPDLFRGLCLLLLLLARVQRRRQLRSEAAGFHSAGIKGSENLQSETISSKDL